MCSSHKSEYYYYRRYKPITNGKLIGTAYYYYISKLMSKYANILGKPDDSHYYAEKAGGLRKAFNDKFFNKKQNRYDNGSETSTVLALALGLTEQSNVKKLFENLNRSNFSSRFRPCLYWAYWLSMAYADFESKRKARSGIYNPNQKYLSKFRLHDKKRCNNYLGTVEW